MENQRRRLAASPAAEPGPTTENSTVIARSDDPSLRTVFKVKYVAEGVAYLEGGRAQGLKEGMKLEVEEKMFRQRKGTAPAPPIRTSSPNWK